MIPHHHGTKATPLDLSKNRDNLAPAQILTVYFELSKLLVVKHDWLQTCNAAIIFNTSSFQCTGFLFYTVSFTSYLKKKQLI